MKAFKVVVEYDGEYTGTINVSVYSLRDGEPVIPAVLEGGYRRVEDAIAGIGRACLCGWKE